MTLPGTYPKFMEKSLKARWQQLLLYNDEKPQKDRIKSFDTLFIAQLITTWAGSDFVADEFSKNSDYLLYFYKLFKQDNGNALLSHCHHQNLLLWFEDIETEDDFGQAIRLYRTREMIRIIWLDLNRLTGTRQVTQDISELADACIETALCWLYNHLTATLGTPYGAPLGKKPVPQKMVVLGMGKLGAKELNLSSDIDLIFAYPNNGEVIKGRHKLTNQEFFIRLGQRLIKMLDARTSDGFVFRVDMRLRPYGQSGIIAMSFSAMEHYYQYHGRDWERYAMIKTRVVAGDKLQGKRLLKILNPFIYRRYIDYGLIASLRKIKLLISQEVKRKDMKQNIKLGPGGIREIEFIVQLFQLINGGKDCKLQKQSLFDVLPSIKSHGYLPNHVICELQQAYLFLRDVEHRLQAVQDKQTQTLPKTEKAKERLAYTMGFKSWDELSEILNKHRNNVDNHFTQVISISRKHQPISNKLDIWRRLWLAELEYSEELKLLSKKGYADPELSLRLLRALRDGKSLSRVERRSRERVDEFMPFLLGIATQFTQPDSVINRLVPLVESVLRRTAYLVLLLENPAALEHLCKLCIASSWVSAQIARTPELLDEFINIGALCHPPKKNELTDELRQQLAHIPEDDLESQMEALRYFKMAHIIRVTAAHVIGSLPLMKESDYLTWIAEVLLDEVVDIAWRNLTHRYGSPISQDCEYLDSGFIIIGYGKLGGIELGPGSDLDLVFVYNSVASSNIDGCCQLDSATFYTRLGQRIIHMLTTRTFFGTLYDIDMRLRPSGSSGLLVCSFNTYQKYLHDDAWTWEQQALVRARFIAGDKFLGSQFEQLRAKVIRRVRDPEHLRRNVVEMRTKIHDPASIKAYNKECENIVNIKYISGGIVDIEFLMQYAVLRHASSHPSLIQWTDNIRISEQLETEGLLSEMHAKALRGVYQQLRLLVHKQSFQNEQPVISASAIQGYTNLVEDLWKQWLEI